MLAPPPAEFSTARELKPARQPNFTAAGRKQVGGAAEGSIPDPVRNPNPIPNSRTVQTSAPLTMNNEPFLVKWTALQSAN